MPIIDILIVLAIAVSVIIGIVRGFINQDMHYFFITQTIPGSQGIFKV